ncbi:exodeoxyribonuclease V subunit beta [Thiomonas sp.]|jgi:exodeoxyribonuclease V beta subunit|uniref:exodeoxyribonuclease V subunit beta n=1 Tax=Thiomonas sp. TaxID=2047785 RepID=UPI00258EBC3B|nr:exodeoxyribonuclease V subunit beta [Thiomonas sp.]
MTAIPDPLDALTLPLQGSRLIEASAGTGKTWTIAALYLRLVLGHGDEASAFARPLSPEQILVMTFTRAATRELAERIRARLVEAAQCFQGAIAPKADDEFLLRLLDSYPPGSARQTAAWRLAMAAQAMDDAAVFTIDAWCQRMLREHAFDSGHSFDEDLVADEGELTTQAVHDFWRQQVYPLSGAALDGVLQVWPDVGALEGEVKSRLRAAQAGAPPVADKDDSLLDLWQRLGEPQQAQVSTLKAQWAERIASMRQWLCALVQSEANPLSKNKYGLKSVCGWFDALQTWLDDPAQQQPDLDDKAWAKLTPDGLRAGCNQGKQVEPPTAFNEVETLRAALADLADLVPKLQTYAAAQVDARLRALKAASGQFSFHDQLERLDAALAGPQGERLRARILEQYPVALIDEFQDTSALQFSVFDRLYGITTAQTTHSAVLLIGDPKQSIYAFRGADIASYLRARQATQGRHSALQTNYRSTAEVVHSVNQLFERREQAAGAGAFLYRGDDAPDAGNPVPFITVGARGRAEQLVCSEGLLPALTCSVHQELESKRDARERFAAHAAARIVSLLNDPQAGFRQADGGFARLRQSDIAVLVRDGDEARAMRRALQCRGVASVYLSDRDSVFASPEAADLLRWLRAVAAPRDGRLARAAFAAPTLGATIDELAALAIDDDVFENRLALLAELQAIWLRQGVLPMLRQTLHRLDLPARWLSEEDGERRLTNVLHLAELLQTASGALDGEQALIRWLREQMAGQSTEEQVVRLESEADLVRVVTIHKSKGLEYPLVFLPFATAFKEAKDGADDRERLREDLRLLYVALTRARHALWVGIAALKVGKGSVCMLHRSAIGYLLGGDTPCEGAAIPGLLRETFGDSPAVQIVDAAQEADLQRLQAAHPAPALIEPPNYHAQFERNWSIGSFSALVRDLTPRSTQQPALQAALQDELWATEPSMEQPSPATLQPSAARHRFPRGALMGKFVHEQLAWLGENGFALSAQQTQDNLLQRCARQGWDAPRSADLLEWLSEVLVTPLPPLGVALPEIDTLLAEMEFWLPVERACAAEIDALCQRHILPGRARPDLTERTLHGMVMGFADLVFHHAGRYWVLDYKSNVLGTDDADYTQQALEAAVLEHRYDVQCALYMLALHRLLRARLRTAYDPQTQLGGAIDLFLRGVRGPRSGCVHIPPDGVLLDALDALFAKREELA